MHIFHKWTKWETIKSGAVRPVLNGKVMEYATGYYWIQERHCMKCNMAQERKVQA